MPAFRDLFAHPWPLIGVLHLPALPGSPGHLLKMSEIRDWAAHDASALLDAGFDGLLVENFGDHPFLPDRVGPETVAAMALVLEDVIRLVQRLAGGRRVAVGLNVLRNDALSALALATVTGARFIRVNVHSGVMVTDQGLLEGKAHLTLRERRRLGAESGVAILADVSVKHASPLGTLPLETVAKDTLYRGRADALILSGTRTGEPTDLDELSRVRRALPEAPLLIGSGLTPEGLEAALPITNGAIVGTFVKKKGQIAQPVDRERARELARARGALVEH